MKPHVQEIQSKLGYSPRSHFHIVTDLQWIWDIFQAGASRLADHWQFKHDLGLWPIPHLDAHDAVWIEPASLVAHNALFELHGQEPIALLTPRELLLESFNRQFLGRTVMSCSVEDIRVMNHYPNNVGNNPWSQPAEGRISGFRAARRSLEQLQSDLLQAPQESLILLQQHVPEITEEWMVPVASGDVFAASPYCIHIEENTNATHAEAIVTIFDIAAKRNDSPTPIGVANNREYDGHMRFDCAHGAEAMRLTHAALMMSEISDKVTAMVNVAFRREQPPIILEISPIWCSSPYGLSACDQARMLQAVAASRVSAQNIHEYDTSTLSEHPSHNDGKAMRIFRPGPWMRQHYAHRYIHQSR